MIGTGKRRCSSCRSTLIHAWIKGERKLLCVNPNCGGHDPEKTP